MTLIHILPPFIVSALGAVIGTVLGFVLGLNIFLSIVISSYLSVLLLFLASLWFDPEPTPYSLKAVLFGLAVYFFLATCAWLFITAACVRLKIIKLL